MKFLKRLLFRFIVVLSFLILLMYVFNVDYLITAVRTIYFKGHTTAFLDDYKYFENRTIPKSTNPQSWAIAKDYNAVKPTEKLEALHKEIGSVAFLIIKNDSVWNENYYDGYSKDSKSNSFSMAKSVVSAALGKAIMDHKIKSLDQLVSDFYPEFKEGKAATMTVGDLSSMASGLDWDESYYDPFSVTTQAYFDTNLAKIILKMKGISDPGKKYEYKSGNTQLLAMVIEKATGENLADYVSKNFWQPMGAEHDALWQTDHKDGLVKAYCCIASNARDFARFGKHYKDYGKWNGKQLLDSAFVVKSITPRFKESPEYCYGWWMRDIGDKHFFMMRGHLGQYVIVEPTDNVIIVRLGHRKSPEEEVGKFSDDISVYIEEAYNMMKTN